MFEKNGKYFADWRDKDGKRKRKSFTSKKAALVFETEQAELARPKARPQVTRSGQSLRPTKTFGPQAAQGKRLIGSSHKLAIVNRHSSQRAM